ncbi:MAG: tellurite resistance TerB family protein [Hyphomicrobium sp.]|nr:tellurite resistance TerB family protein [Hyphomicrobium sp.]
MTTAALTAPEALIYAMITIAAVDRTISDDELSRIGSIVKELPSFKSYDRNWLTDEAQACGRILSKPDGLEKVLGLVRDNLPDHLRETAYVLAAEVAASDLKVRPEEVRCLELLAERLSLDKLTCAALERAARARHQRA